MLRISQRSVRMLGLATVLLASLVATAVAQAPATVRVGHFPNITHVQALVAHNFERQGREWFSARLGPGLKIEWYVYNAGPSAMEAIFANIAGPDLCRAKPGDQCLCAFARRRDQHRRGRGERRLRAGGAAEFRTLTSPADFRGKRIATPQFGNTQDVAARAWLAAGGLRITQTGGDAQVLPTANPDQLCLFQRKQVDAVWTVEPWVSRLELEAGGKVLVEEQDTVTTVLVGERQIPRRAARCSCASFVAAHRGADRVDQGEPRRGTAAGPRRIARRTRAELSPELIARAWKRMTYRRTRSRCRAFSSTCVSSAQQVGFLRDAPDLSRLIEPP